MRDGPRSGASGMIVTIEHTGTHIDALCHQAAHLALCGGVPVDAATQTPRGFTRHGVEEIAPIVGPGLLLDVAALRGVEALPPGYAVTVENIEACCARQGVAVAAGDVVLVRTGNERYWEESERYLAGPGVHGDGSRWLARRGVRAVGADTMAWDVIGLRGGLTRAAAALMTSIGLCSVATNCIPRTTRASVRENWVRV